MPINFNKKLTFNLPNKTTKFWENICEPYMRMINLYFSYYHKRFQGATNWFENLLSVLWIISGKTL